MVVGAGSTNMNSIRNEPYVFAFSSTLDVRLLVYAARAFFDNPSEQIVGNRGDGNLRLHRAGRAGAR